MTQKEIEKAERRAYLQLARAVEKLQDLKRQKADLRKQQSAATATRRVANA